MKKFLLTQKITLFLVIMSLIVSLSMGDSVIPNSPQTIDQTPNSIDDLEIDFTLNQTSIGRHNGALAEIFLKNTGTNPVSNVKVNFTLDGDFAEFSSTYPSYQEVSLLNPTQNSTINVEVILNLTQVDGNAAADVVLVFDASGSMSGEIDSVKAEFTDVVNRLSESINSLRIGMIVYGWNKYSEYPASSVYNYVELTTNHDDVLDLIDELYAAGGTEPWGDAFAVINDWDWREDVPKLAIIVGDEDCDPGNIVGVGSTDSWYNGTQLVDVITSLKEKGVIINSVITGLSANVENQFNWIADYTGGECVYLEELQSGTDPVDLPELIESWTLELVREYFVDLNVNISWTELPKGDPIYNSTELSEVILIDLATPTITVSTISNNIIDTEYELEIYATIKDISGIAQVNMYYTFDSLTGPYDPTWHFMILTDVIGSTYYTTLDNLEEGDKVSFYIEAMDDLSNVGLTVIYNITIALNPVSLGSIVEFLFTEDNSTRNISFNFTDPNYYYNFNSDPDMGYLWIESDQSLIVTFDASDFLVTTLYTGPTNKIFRINKTSVTDLFIASIQGDTSNSTIKVKWTILDDILDFDYFDYDKPIIDEIRRTTLFHAHLSISGGSGFFTLIPYDPELVALVTIFDSDWTIVDTVGTYENIELTNGEYYFWVEQVVRSGAFALYYGPEEVTNGDPYYREYANQTSIPYGVLFSSFVLLGVFVTLRKRKKSKKGAN